MTAQSQGDWCRDNNPNNEREVNKQAKGMDMFCHFSSTIPGKKKSVQQDRGTITESKERLFRFLHPSKLLSNNTTSFVPAAGRYSLFIHGPGEASSKIRRACVWKRGFR